MSGTPNIPLLRKAVEWAEAEAAKPFDVREWEQRFYTLSADDLVDFPSSPWALIRAQKAPTCGTCYCIAGWVAAQKTGLDRPLGSEEIAQLELGLTGDQADDLFHASNTIEDVRRIAEDIAGERL